MTTSTMIPDFVPNTMPKTDPIISFYFRDANAALLRAHTAVLDELASAPESPSINASTLTQVHELRDITAAFAQLLTDLATDTRAAPAS